MQQRFLMGLPGLRQLWGYQKSWLRGDILAGITVAAYLIPQCMAYGELVGVPPVVGLWTILPAMLVYAVFGSSRQLSVGPESTTSVMTAAAIAPLLLADGSNYDGDSGDIGGGDLCSWLCCEIRLSGKFALQADFSRLYGRCCHHDDCGTIGQN
jgi:MFS superfamily sulfate permease-like transporter